MVAGAAGLGRLIMRINFVRDMFRSTVSAIFHHELGWSWKTGADMVDLKLRC